MVQCTEISRCCFIDQLLDRRLNLRPGVKPEGDYINEKVQAAAQGANWKPGQPVNYNAAHMEHLRLQGKAKQQNKPVVRLNDWRRQMEQEK